MRASFLTRANRTNGPRLLFCISDVQSSKLTEGKQTNDQIGPRIGNTCPKLREIVAPVRTPQKSKRRLIYFAHADEEAASICYAATEESEQRNMLEFFERHSRYAKQVIDKCSMLDNSWETEFHLSYYQLLEKSQILRLGIPPLEAEQFPGGRGKQIARVSTSFRFKGDLFDRYWTCHWLQYIHKGSEGIQNKPHIRLGRKRDRQRKVLEQTFVAEILKGLTDNIGEILEEIHAGLGIKQGFFSTSILSKDAYSFLSARWQQFEPHLRTLKEDLAITQSTVEDWVERDRERGVNRPRWTRGDERKYGGSVMTIRRDIRHHMNKLGHLHANIRSLHESYSEHLAKARDELSFRSDQSIVTFTYVTVVFLPLGFAASIFSMSEPPAMALVISMVTVALAALGVTVIALVNGSILATMMRTISSEFNHLTAVAQETSVLIRIWKCLENKGAPSNGGDHSRAFRYTPGAMTVSWNLIFWMGYIFVEVPAWIIAVACRAGGFTKDPLAKGFHQSLLPTLAIFGEPVTQLVHGHRPGHFKRLSRMSLGLLILPMFLVTWILQFLCFNGWDILILCRGKPLAKRVC